MPIGPLTPQLEQLATLASAPDAKNPESSSGDASAGVSHGKHAHHHVQAFSGKGHTLSSGPRSNLASAPRVDPVMRTAKLVAEKSLVDLRQQESILQYQVGKLYTPPLYS